MNTYLSHLQSVPDWECCLRTATGKLNTTFDTLLAAFCELDALEASAVIRPDVMKNPVHPRYEQRTHSNDVSVRAWPY